MIMSKPPLDRPVVDEAPTACDLAPYDQEHFATYLRLLDAEAEGATDETERARSAWVSHLARAKRLIEQRTEICSGGNRRTIWPSGS